MLNVEKRYELAQVASLTPHPRNPRRGDVEAIKASIRRTGFYGAVLVQERHDDGRPSRTIIAGEHRWRAIRELGSTIVPACFVDVTDAEALSILLVDNRTADRGTYDEVRLLAILEAARADGSDGLEGTGYDEAFLAALQRRLAAENAAEDIPGEDALLALTMRWGTDARQLWTIAGQHGRDHRLVIGPSENPATYQVLLPGGEKVVGIWTDPPYGVSYQGAAGTVANDDLSAPGLLDLVARALTLAAEHARPGAPVFVAHPAGPLQRVFYDAAERAGLETVCSLAWVKGAGVLGRSDHHYRHEPVLLCHVPCGGQGAFLAGRAPLSSVSRVPKPSRSELHPTMKPLALIEEHLEATTSPGDLVLDMFAGSGSTGIACERTGRVARLVELTPRYAASCLERFSQLGLAPVRAEGVPV